MLIQYGSEKRPKRPVVVEKTVEEEGISFIEVRSGPELAVLRFRQGG